MTARRPVLAAAAYGVNLATRRLKERVTFPRTGYVEWKAPAAGTRIGAAAVAIIAALALGWTHGGWSSVNWLFLGLGLVLAAIGGVRLARFLHRHPSSAEDGR